MVRRVSEGEGKEQLNRGVAATTCRQHVNSLILLGMIFRNGSIKEILHSDLKLLDGLVSPLVGIPSALVVSPEHLLL